MSAARRALSTVNKTITFLGAKASADIDKELMAIFSTEQLMELAGLAVAQITHEHYFSLKGSNEDNDDNAKSPSGGHHRHRPVIVICGPGNNGGDGLVAARHLKQFGVANVSIVYPKRTDKPLYHSLVKQAELCEIPFFDTFVEALPKEPNQKGKDKVAEDDTALVIDAIFGYSFKQTPAEGIREPFASIIKSVNNNKRSGKVETIAVDVPSGWDVDHGDVTKETLSSDNSQSNFVAMDTPNVLISLMTPKLGVVKYPQSSPHYLGGRFVPDKFAKEHGIELATYPQSQQWVDITGCQQLQKPMQSNI